MATHAKQYLYIRRSYSFSVTEAEIGTGKTLTAKICATSTGDPTAISSCTGSAAASSGVYTVTLARTLLQSALSASLTKVVYAHLDDGAAWHDVFPMVVTDVAPETLPALV